MSEHTKEAERMEPSGYGFDWPHELGAIMAKVDNYADEQIAQASRTMSTPDYADCHRLRAEVATALHEAWNRRAPAPVWPEPGAPAPAVMPPLGAARPPQDSEMRAVICEFAERFAGIDNGYCMICGRHRLHDTRGNPQPCSDPGCLSNRASALIFDTPDTEPPADVPQWRPAYSAPRDGTEIIAWREDAGPMLVHFVAPSEVTDSDDDERAWWTTDGDELASDPFTHWMPLPRTP